MKLEKISTILGVIIIAVLFFVWSEKKNSSIPFAVTDVNSNQEISTLPKNQIQQLPSSLPEHVYFVPPLNRAVERITKKPFGIHISKATSPVQPERFSGYHTGVDFETFPDEADIVVTIEAVCAGTVVYKKRVSGYGGVLVQSCEGPDGAVTVLYGHLALTSISLNLGDAVAAGQRIGALGKGFSTETDGERKHLHLGIHRSNQVDVRGYVTTESGLSPWLDAMKYLSI